MHVNGIARHDVEHDGLELVKYGAGHAWLEPAQQETARSTSIVQDTTIALAEVVEAALYVQLAAYPEPGCRFGICEQRADLIVVSETQVPIGIQVELLCGFHADRRDAINTILAVIPLAAVYGSPTADPEPDHSELPQHPRWSGEWDTYVFETPTTYPVVAPNLEAAHAWFTDDADPDVDCGPMTFGRPRLLRVVSERAHDEAQRPHWFDRLRPLAISLRPALRFLNRTSVQADMPTGGA